MKHTNLVRRPSLANSTINTDDTSALSIGDTLRRAKKNLFFSRCLIAILVVLLITGIAFMIYMGYANELVGVVTDAID